MPRTAYKKNQEAVDRLKKKQQEEKPRLSPITGEPMEQVVLDGVVIDRCPTSGGIWLDAGELEELIEAAKNKGESESGFLSNLIKGFSGAKG